MLSLELTKEQKRVNDTLELYGLLPCAETCAEIASAIKSEMFCRLDDLVSRAFPSARNAKPALLALARQFPSKQKLGKASAPGLFVTSKGQRALAEYKASQRGQ